MITLKYLKEILTYNKKTGLLKWKLTRGTRAIKYSTAGTLNKQSGYICIKIDGKVYKAHRLAFLYVHGYLPAEVGHDNQNCSDNRIKNLVDLSHAENMKNKKVYKNNTTGATGVTWHKHLKKWQAHIRIDNRSIHLGYFDYIDKASQKREQAKRQYNFHKNHS